MSAGAGAGAGALELPGQLAFTTSSSKKRKLARPSILNFDSRDSLSPDTAIPSCEPDDNETVLSFAATPIASGLEALPSASSSSYLPTITTNDSSSLLPASSVPPRLQTLPGSLVSADYASSNVSSPSASHAVDPFADSDRGGDETASSYTCARSLSPFRLSKKAIMNGDAELPHRSSSPLKRRASSMDPEPTDAVNNNNSSSSSKNGPDAAAEHAAADAAADAPADVQMESPDASTVLPRAMSVDVPDQVEPANIAENPHPPPLAEQVKTIETLLKAFEESPVKEGDKVYVVSRKWVERALALRDGSKSASKMETEDSSLGPVDNSDIIEEIIKEPSGTNFIRLKPGTGQEELALFPEDAWKLVMEWYGIRDGQEPIIRTAINTAVDAQSPTDVVYELHPPVFRIHRLWSQISPLPIEQSLKARNPPALVVSRSRKYRAQTFIKDLKLLADIPIQRKIRIFSISEPLPAGPPVASRSALTPPDSPRQTPDSGKSPSSWSNLLLDLGSYTAVPSENRLRVSLEDQTTNEKYNGTASLQVFSLVTDQTLVLDEAIDKNSFVSTFTADRARSAEKSIPTRANAASSKPSSSRNSPIPDGPVTRGRAQKGYGRSAGAVGLHNLGNTCYMNSALQCVRSVEELTKYFLTDSYCEEINKTNPLGYNGKVAMAYGSLLKEIYEEGRGSVSPREFKNTVGRCRSAFAGWGQQDSQEFLGFLLDALQEDLSRIKNKPYIEKPDSTDDMVNDPEAIREMADKVWDITRKRDDSVIADLFTGMYKSTLKCPECGKISITFDPFNNLTLPLPVENMWTHCVKFFPLNDVPVKIEVELPRHSSMEALKQFLSIRTGVPAERLIGAEEFKDRFFKIYDNNSDISEDIQTGDFPTFHELEAVPTNWPCKGARKAVSMLDVDTPHTSGEWDDPMYDTMVVPVLHRRPNAIGRAGEGASPPHFITLTREEACNYDIIRRKVLERVATFSTWSKFYTEDDVEDLDVSGDADLVHASTSDAGSSAGGGGGGGKVTSKSLSGDDDLVDITMRDASSVKNELPPLPNQPQILRHFNRHRPGFIRPDSFLEPELQSLFELSYFANVGDGTVPTGWSNVDNNKVFPKLTDRIPSEPSVRDENEPSPESWNSAGSVNEESSSDEAQPKALSSSETRMVDESSEDENPHGGRGLSRRGNGPFQKGPGGRKKFKNHKTYGKKGNKRRERQMRGGKQQHRMPAVNPQPMPPAIADGGPLVRLYEGLIVDWNEEAWEVVFNGAGPSQGSRTFVDPEILKDPALKISQRKRASRRSRGITLEECLDEFERAEVLSEQDMWYCPRCKEHRRASKKFDLWKTPDYLVAHLKRFSSSGWRRDKLDVLVDFPIEGLDLTSRVIEKANGKQEIYDLIAVDDHYGGLGGGHYTAYAKNFVDGRWYNYNDTSVSPVSDPSSMITSAAYLLFYRRRTSAAQHGGHRFGQIIEKFNSTTNSADVSGESGDEGGFRGGAGAGAGSSMLKPGARDAAAARLSSSADTSSRAALAHETTHGETIRSSIEDDTVDVADHCRQPGAASLDMTQSWSFNGLDGSGAEGSTAADFASDDAQFESSGDERGGGSGGSGGGFLLEVDTHMTSVEDGFLDGRVPSSPVSNGDGKAHDNGNIKIIQEDVEEMKEWGKNGAEVVAMSIPAADEGEETSQVTEIHLDGETASKAA